MGENFITRCFLQFCTNKIYISLSVVSRLMRKKNNIKQWSNLVVYWSGFKNMLSRKIISFLKMVYVNFTKANDMAPVVVKVNKTASRNIQSLIKLLINHWTVTGGCIVCKHQGPQMKEQWKNEIICTFLLTTS